MLSVVESCSMLEAGDGTDGVKTSQLPSEHQPHQTTVAQQQVTTHPLPRPGWISTSVSSDKINSLTGVETI